MLSFDDFFKAYNGKSNVGNTPENKGQCVGLVAMWVDNLGLPHIWGNAEDLYANADSNFFEKIPNTATAVPIKGDIGVWSSQYNRTVGHTGIATGKGDVNTAEWFVQNDPTGSNCHLRTYSYFAIIGWLRPRVTVTPSDTITITKDQFTQLVTKSTAYDDLKPKYDALVILNHNNEESMKQKDSSIATYKGYLVRIKQIITESKV